MKIISTCERQFISNCVISIQKRLDGRQLLEGRNLEIVFGKERGCCMVIQGNTRTLAQVSCEVTEPKTNTPTEGSLHVNLELSAMASPDAKSLSRTSGEAVEAQRSLERCIRDSKCIDLEPLCIVTGSKAWTIRVDVHTLNDDGSLIECASIAAISALAHFRRPDVTFVNNEVIINSPEDREPVPLNLLHMPISVNLALYEQGKYILVDPIAIEEKVADGCFIIGMNAHQEICFVRPVGVLLLNEESVQRCEDIAIKRAQEVTQAMRKALDDDAYKRATKAPIGFTNLIQTDTILGAKHPIAEINLDKVKSEDIEVTEVPGDNPELIEICDDGDKTHPRKASAAKERAMKVLQQPETSLFEGGPSKWGIESNDVDDEEESSEEEPDKKLDSSAVKEESDMDSEEETVYVDEHQVDMKPNTRRWYSNDPFM